MAAAEPRIITLLIDKIQSGLYRAEAQSHGSQVTEPSVYSSISDAIRVEARAVPSSFALFMEVRYNGLSSGTSGIVPVNDTSFPGEFVDSYELGMKTTWLGGNLLINGAVFHQEYSDFQLNSFLGTSFVVRSIPEVTSQGVDAELLSVLLADAGPTPALAMLPGFAPASSVSWALELRPVGGIDAQGLWRMDKDAIATGEGYVNETTTLWTPCGQMAALGYQVVAVYG